MKIKTKFQRNEINNFSGKMEMKKGPFHGLKSNAFVFS